jgi:hypothetical protein
LLPEPPKSIDDGLRGVDGHSIPTSNSSGDDAEPVVLLVVVASLEIAA